MAYSKLRPYGWNVTNYGSWEFQDEEQRDCFTDFMDRYVRTDSAHGAVMFLLSLRTVRDHIGRLFDFANDMIIPDGVDDDWVTSGTRRDILTAFTLWNGSGGFSVYEVMTDDADTDARLEALRIFNQRCEMDRRKNSI